jgi:hypothetical protein
VWVCRCVCVAGFSPSAGEGREGEGRKVDGRDVDVDVLVWVAG